MFEQNYIVFRVPGLDKEGALFIAPFTHGSECPVGSASAPLPKCSYKNAAAELVTATTVEGFPLESLQKVRPLPTGWVRDRDEAILAARASIRRLAEMLARHPGIPAVLRHSQNAPNNLRPPQSD